MSAARSSRPAAVWALMALLLLQGISGIAGGVSLVAAVTLLPAVRRFCGGTLGR